MSFSPASSGDEADAELSPCPSEGGATRYVKCLPQFATPPVGPSWGKTLGSTVVCMRNGKIYVAARIPHIVEAPGVFGPVVAFAGPKGPPLNGCWRHTRNRFKVSRFVPPDAVSVRALPCPTFRTINDVFLTFFGALHCDYVAVFRLQVNNCAFVGLGIVRGQGCVILGHALEHYSFAAAKALLAEKTPIMAECTVLDSKRHTLTPAEQRALLGENVVRRQLRRMGTCWHATWNGRQWTKQRSGALVEKTAVNYQKNGLILITLWLTAPLHGRVQCFLEEKPAYDKNDKLLGTLQPGHEVSCRLLDPLTIQIPVPLAKMIRLQKTRDHPRISATIGCFCPSSGQPKSAIGNVQIRRHWHTDARTGNGYRVRPRSRRFAYVPAQYVPAGVPEVARVNSADTHVGLSIPRQLLSLVRAEDLPPNVRAKTLAELLPGEAQVTLQTLQEIRDAPRKRRWGDVVGEVARYRQCTASSAPKKGCFVTAPCDLQF